MTQILKQMKIHPNIIEIVFKVYHKDKTNLILNGKNYAEMDISNGIRQGCNCSALIFSCAQVSSNLFSSNPFRPILLG